MLLNGSDVRRINNRMSGTFQCLALDTHKPKTVGSAGKLLNDITHKLIMHSYEKEK